MGFSSMQEPGKTPRRVHRAAQGLIAKQQQNETRFLHTRSKIKGKKIKKAGKKKREKNGGKT